MWVIIDLEDLDKVINFPYTWYAKYSANAKGYYACATQYLPELKHGRTSRYQVHLLFSNSFFYYLMYYDFHDLH